MTGAQASHIGHSVIGHWSLTQLGNKKHVANLAKLTNLANLTIKSLFENLNYTNQNAQSGRTSSLRFLNLTSVGPPEWS